MKITSAILIVAVVLCTACSSRPSNSRPLTRAEVGADWPFTVLSGELQCLPGSYVVFKVGNDTYTLNGRARGVAKKMQFLDADAITGKIVMLDAVQQASTLKMIEDGLTLCAANQ